MEDTGMPPSESNPTVTQFIPENTKKRKTLESRSRVWDHFEKIVNNDGLVIKGKCLYCSKVYAAEAKKHGTSSLNTHMRACLKNPHAKETKQTTLAFQSGKSDNGDVALSSWIFNQEVVRKSLAKMIIIDELPFRFVEGRGFRKFIQDACPRFKIPSRWTVNRDIYSIYFDEKMNLKKLFKSSTQRISLTTDTWTSVQRINYMCITAHYIDDEWKLNKKVISFVQINSHKGESIAKALETCLLEWGVKNIFTITVDNASSNDVAVGFMKKKLVSWGGSSTRAEYIHMRCIAHILNLVVQDGLKLADTSVKKIRDCVRWVRGSPSRLNKFRELAELFELEEKSSLCLDVPTRWNSTYLMLRTAIAYKQVFEMYESSDSTFSLELGTSVPSCLDWLSVQSLVVFLKTFYEMTIRISASLYVTLHSFLSEISDLSCIIADMLQSVSKIEADMGAKMKEKFSKYWGDPDKMNFIIFFGNIMDPRDKVEYMQVQLTQMYGEIQGKLCLEKVKSKLSMLFQEYVSTYSKDSTTTMMPPPPPVQCENVPVGKVQSRLKSQLKKQKMESGALLNKKSELEVYLSESTVDDTNDFDILRWWKVNNQRFPILSKVARDILAVPISTVASESTFSTSGRVLDDFRSSLSPKMVEALVCTQDWLRGPNQPLAVEENIDDVEKFEKELMNVGIGSSSYVHEDSHPTVDLDDV